MEFAQKVRPDVLGARVKAARVAIHMTQEAAAIELDMARITLAAIEAGKRTISSRELRKIAVLFDVNESELINTGIEFRELGLQAFRAAHKKEFLSEQQIASMLKLDLVSVRKALQDHSEDDLI